jgi:hypothetical protein
MKKSILLFLTILTILSISVVGMEVICGDGICNGGDGERVASAPTYCPEDCEQPCGDGYCDSAYGEDLGTSISYCEADCPDSSNCGNGVCDEDENYYLCSQDCFCGDGKCNAGMGENYNCPEDCGIGAECGSKLDHFCKSSCGENEEKVDYNCPASSSDCCKKVYDPTYKCIEKGFKCTSRIAGCGLDYAQLDYSCPDQTVCCESVSFCGDGICDREKTYPDPENEETCPNDCSIKDCVDEGFICTSGVRGCGLEHQRYLYKCPEKSLICCEAVSYCGDGICDTKITYPEQENKNTCPEDCWPDFNEEEEIVSSHECPDKSCVVKSSVCSGNDKIVIQECTINTKIGSDCKESVTTETKILKGDCETNVQEEDVCNGCQVNSKTCIPLGTRLKKQDTLYYCAIDNKMTLQLRNNEECQNGYECESNNCKSGNCRPICEGCSDESSACLPVGSREQGTFCDSSYVFTNQYIEDSKCHNNYECETNICVNSECISPNLIQKLMTWLKSIFS